MNGNPSFYEYNRTVWRVENKSKKWEKVVSLECQVEVSLVRDTGSFLLTEKEWSGLMVKEMFLSVL